MQNNEKHDKHPLTFALFLGSFKGRYQAEISRGVADEAKKNGINLISYAGGSLKDPYEHHKQQNIIYQLIKSQQIQGLISVSGSLGNFIQKNELTQFLNSYQNIQILSLGMAVQGRPSITIDNAMGIRLAMEHFIIHHGFRNIAYLGGPLGNPEAEIRLNTYLGTLELMNIKQDPAIIFQGDFTFKSGVAIAKKISELNIKPEAILAANDEMALGLISEFQKSGLSIPKDIAIIGFDDIEEARCITTPLTTIHQPIRTLGIHAVRILLDCIQKQEMLTKIELPTRLVIRQSCGCHYNNYAKAINLSENDRKAWPTDEEQINLISLLVKDMEIKFSGFDDAMTLFIWAKSLVENLFTDLELNSTEHFSPALDKIIHHSHEAEVFPVLWYSVINNLFESIINNGSSKHNRQQLDKLWRQSLENIGSIGIREESAFRLNSFTKFSDIQQTNQKLSQALSEKDLTEQLDKQIPQLGIKHCHILLYKNEEDIINTSQSKIFYSLYPDKNTDQTIDNHEYFDSQKLLPNWNEFTGNSVHFILLPLYFHEINLGYVLFEKIKIESINYQLLAAQLSSSIMGARLLDRIKQNSINLESEVKAKTEDLKNTTNRLKSEILQREITEEALNHEREQALVTLESIGDGVIATDNTGIVTYLNPVAERLTGWTDKEARGLPLKKILKISYSQQGQSIINATKIALNEDRSIKLSGSVTLTSRDGRIFSIQESISPIRNRENITVGVVLVLHNISETERMSRELIYTSSHDSLTNLYNRSKFEEILLELIASAKEKNEEHTLCYIDLDKFSIINTNESSLAGDQLLIRFSELLKASVRSSDIIGRLGGDQFGIILNNCAFDLAKEIVEELHQKITLSSFLWNEKSYTIEASIGLIPIRSSSASVDRLISLANIACVFAKKQGGNRIQLYQYGNKDLKKYQNEINFVSDIHKAIEEDRLVLYSQTIQPIGRTKGVGEHQEVLIRMIDKNGQMLSPASFISTAEKHNIMPLIDRWTIQKLFSSYRVDYNETPNHALAKYSINLSGASLNDEKFLDYVFEQFTLYDIPPFMICFEITETAAISNVARIAQFIKELKRIGVCFSLDDFGTGWSSFNYLKLLPVDFLKIDGSFVRGICESPLDLVLVETINHIGHVLGLQTIAEYVENEDILQKLKEIGVNYAQGYGIGIPEPLKF